MDFLKYVERGTEELEKINIPLVTQIHELSVFVYKTSEIQFGTI